MVGKCVSKKPLNKADFVDDWHLKITISRSETKLIARFAKCSERIGERQLFLAEAPSVMQIEWRCLVFSENNSQKKDTI
jgi:hypothetical protein